MTVYLSYIHFRLILLNYGVKDKYKVYELKVSVYQYFICFRLLTLNCLLTYIESVWANKSLLEN